MAILDDDSQLTNNESLTIEERTLKERCEAEIDEFRRSFIKAGLALELMRSRRLYRETHSSFEAYCEQLWGMKRAHAHRLIDSAKVVETIKCLPMGDTFPLPSNERQVRPLTLLKQPEQIQQAWQNALKSTEGKPTAEAVEKAVKELKGFLPRKSRKQPTVEQQGEVSDHKDDDRKKMEESTTADATTSAPQNEREAEGTPVGIDSSAPYYTTGHDNENKNGNKDSQNPPLKETSSCQWIRDALQRRIMQILLYDQALGMKIERLAKEKGRLPQTIIAWAVDALEVLPAREEKITELSVELGQCKEQALAQKSRLAELEQVLAQKDDKLTELQQTVAGFEINKADLAQKLTESEHYAAVASTKVAELERELFAALQTVASLTEQSLATAQASNNATDQPSNNSIPDAAATVPSSNPVPNLKSLIDFFDRAAEKLEKPTVQIVLNDKTIVVSRNSNSYVGKHPGVLNLNTWDGIWHGRINRDGSLFKNRDWQEWVAAILEEFASNPQAQASQQGKATGSCCFCNRVLTDARSLQTGYGEVCARHYGLTWPLEQPDVGQTDVEQTDLEQPDVGQPDVGQPTSEHPEQVPVPNGSNFTPLKQRDLVQITSARHGSEIVGKYGTVLDVTDVGCLVEVEEKKFFFSEDELILSSAELPF